MSIPLLLNLDQNNSENNLNLSKKLTNNSEKLEEKNKNKFMTDINSLITRQIYFFKDEILKDVNDIIDKLILKISFNFKEINEKITKNEERFNLISERIDKLFEKTLKYEPYEERINELFDYKIKNEKDMQSHLEKFKDIKNEMKENFTDYDIILKKFKSSEEIVGVRRKFKTYPDLINYLYQNISQFNAYQEKSNVDLKGYKTKLDSTISSFRNQINTIINSMKNFTTSNIKESEGRIKGLINLFDERLIEIRSENNQFRIDIKNENDKLFKETVNKIKEEINNQLGIEILNFNDLLKKTQKRLEEDISKCDNNISKLKEDFDKFKLNEEDKKFDFIKIIKMIKEKNINLENKNNHSDIKQNLTQRNINNPSLNISNSNPPVDSYKKFVFNISNNNNIKEMNNDEIEIKNEEKPNEIINNNINEKRKENKSPTIIKKKYSSKELNNIYRIKRISKTSKYKNLNNYSEVFKDKKDIRDNINKEDKINKSLKNLNELKEKDLPKIEEDKKKEVDDIDIFPNRTQRFILKTNREDNKHKTSNFFLDNQIKRRTKRVQSTINVRKKKIIIKQTDNSQNNLEFSENSEKKSNSKGNRNINHKVNAYDILFKPNKDNEKDKKVKKEENKNSQTNIYENNIEILKIRKFSTSKNKKLEYSYINSKGEISNIIEMPPPEDVIYKSIFALG